MTIDRKEIPPARHAVSSLSVESRQYTSTAANSAAMGIAYASIAGMRLIISTMTWLISTPCLVNGLNIPPNASRVVRVDAVIRKTRRSSRRM